MINSKEQYKRVMKNAEFQGKMPVEHVGLLAETIEALQEVARAAQFAKYMAAAFHDTALNEQLDKLRVALDEIPDWITDD